MAAPVKISELTSLGSLSAGAAVAIVQGGLTQRVPVSAFVTQAPAFTPSGSGAIPRTASASLAALVRTGDFGTVGQFNTARDALTETIGVSGLSVKGSGLIAQSQALQADTPTVYRFTPVTPGAAPFEMGFSANANSGGGAGTYNNAMFYGYNVGRHSGGSVTSGKPALLMGMEDNYFDVSGDATYGMEWYVEYWSPDGTSITLFRPFYTRVLSDNNSRHDATITFDVGTDGGGEFDVRAGIADSIFNAKEASVTIHKPLTIDQTVEISGVVTLTSLQMTSGTTSSLAFQTTGGTQFKVAHTANAVNWVQVAGGAAGSDVALFATGASADTGMGFSTSGAGGYAFYSDGFSNIQFQVLRTASATRYVTVTGSNGGNPTIGTSAGSLAIAPAVVAASSITAHQGTAIPAGGTAGAGLMVSSTSNFGVFFGSGVPSLSAAKGSLYLRSDGSSTSTRAYINTDGSTTWTAITTAA